MAAKQKNTAHPLPVKTRQAKPAARVGGPTSVPSWMPLVVIVFTAFLYSQAVNNGITYIDDDYYLLRNYYLRDFSWNGIKAIFTHFYSFNYHPLTTISNLVEYRFWGLNPVPYHSFNVVLHLLNIWLVYKVTENLSGKSMTALVVCVLFAVHPMHVESVAWIAERKDVLYAAFYLAAILQYQRYTSSGYNAKNYIFTLLLFVGALLSKSAAVTLPVILIAIDVYKGRSMNSRAILEKIPFLLLAILFGILAIMSQQAGGAINDLGAKYTLVTRIFMLTAGIASYFIRLVAPVGLSAIHYFPDLHGGTTLPWYYYLSLPFLGVLGWLAFRPSAYRKEMIFGVSFFFIAISVMLQIVTVGAAISSERYTYISYIGLFYIAGQYIADKWESPSANTIISIFSAFVVLFSIQTWSRIGVWKDTNILFTDIIDKNPDNWRDCYVYYYWGVSKGNEGTTLEAIDMYTKAIKLKPDFDRAYNARGLGYDLLHDTKSAIADFDRAISINPAKAEFYNNRGWAYYEAGDRPAAIKNYTQAIAVDPKYPEAYNNRGWAQYEAGDTRAAMADYDKAIALDPKFRKPYFNRAAIKINTKDFKGAIADYDQLIKMDPNDPNAYSSRGVARLNIQDTKACDDWRKAYELGSTEAGQMLQQYCK